MDGNIKQALEDTIRQELAAAGIDHVYLEEDIDSDGEKVLRVTIVVDAIRNLDASKTAGLVRHMRSSIDVLDADFIFPIVAFRSRAEHKRLNPEAA